MAESTDQRQRPEEMDQVYVEEVDIEIEPAAGVSPDTPHNHTDGICAIHCAWIIVACSYIAKGIAYG